MNPKKVLVLGSHATSRDVDSFPWNATPERLNVADYDLVILNLAVFEEDETLRKSVQTFRLPDGERFDRLLLSPSEVIAIGPLSTPIGSSDIHTERADWWLPVDLATRLESGDVRSTALEWDFYFDAVKRYAWYFDHLESGVLRPRRDLRGIHPQANAVEMLDAPMAKTRFGKAVAVSLQFRAMSVSRSGPEGLTEPGTVILLPSPTEVSVEEAIELILSNRHSISVEQEAPPWLNDFQLPHEVGPRKDAEEAKRALEDRLAELRGAEEGIAREARFRKLLYETGEALEPIVRDALRSLGATVFDPAEKGREDGRLEFDESMAMLEIKGRKGSLKLSDVRELDQWVRDALVDWPSKGILIGCLHNRDQPRDRKAPFPPNCITLAERADICLLTTSQLYEAVRRNQLGELDVEAFFSAVLGASGVCPVPDLDDVEP